MHELVWDMKVAKKGFYLMTSLIRIKHCNGLGVMAIIQLSILTRKLLTYWKILKILTNLTNLISLRESKNFNGFCNKIFIFNRDMRLSKVIHISWNSLLKINRDLSLNVLIFMVKGFTQGPIQIHISSTIPKHPINCFKRHLKNNSLKNKKSCITKWKDKLFKVEVLY